jgi:hypothetical protein
MELEKAGASNPCRIARRGRQIALTPDQSPQSAQTNDACSRRARTPQRPLRREVRKNREEAQHQRSPSPLRSAASSNPRSSAVAERLYLIACIARA